MSRLECLECKRMMPLDMFPTTGKNAGNGTCRPCVDRLRGLKRRKYEGDAFVRSKASEWNSKYGLSVEEYSRLDREQQGRCAIHRGVPKSGMLVVDHDHATGRVRGLLCPSCNTAIGLFRENPNYLRAAIEYLLNGAESGLDLAPSHVTLRSIEE